MLEICDATKFELIHMVKLEALTMFLANLPYPQAFAQPSAEDITKGVPLPLVSFPRKSSEITHAPIKTGTLN